MTGKYQSIAVRTSEITPHSLYLSRREFLKAAGVITGSTLLVACTAGREATAVPAREDEFGDRTTSFEEITHYNNYYEFSENKEVVSRLSADFQSHPWTIEVSGMVSRPGTYGVEDLLSRFPQEERIYRLRCVEGWSMVIPWNGFPLASLLKEVEPLSGARYVRFETLLDQEQFPHQGSHLYPWPYREGLRLDEAMHSLTILASGIYGQALPNQNGAPMRLVVPWKYGFKSIKAIIKIELVSQQPATFWRTINRRQYGFYSNVNPNPIPSRWSQAWERRIGELEKRPTLMFNGYAEEVAHLYEGMDLIKNY